MTPSVLSPGHLNSLTPNEAGENGPLMKKQDRPLKVLMTTDTVGGVWTYTLELARALAEWPVEIYLATMGDLPSDAQRQEAAALPNVQLFPSEFKLEWMEEPWSDVAAAALWLLTLERRLKPDLIHLNNFVHAALHWQAPVLVVGHSCVLSWWQAVKGEPAPAEWNTYRRLVRRGVRAADMVVAPTKAMLKALYRYYGPCARSMVVYNARRSELFQPKKKEPFIFAAGRLWDEAKNIATLARVADVAPWPVYVAGNGKHPAGGEIEFDNLHELGQLKPPALADYYGRASIYALPARYEPFGLTALEAALSGAALVLGDIPSLREVWGEAALFVPPDNEAALAHTLHRLADYPLLRMEMAERAYERAQFYSPTRMAEAYLRVYRSLLLTHQRPVERPAVQPHKPLWRLALLERRVLQREKEH